MDNDDEGMVTDQELAEARKRFAGQTPMLEEIFGKPIVEKGFRADTAVEEATPNDDR